MPVRRLATGRYQADVADSRRGLVRTKRTFTSRKEAREWEAAVLSAAHDTLLGRPQRVAFGTALTRYLTEESPRKRTHQDDLDNAQALRRPYWDPARGTWATLEHLPLDGGPQGIVAGMAAWLADQRAILQRSRLGGERYERRQGPEGPAWYYQPPPSDGPRPKPRQRVTDPATLAALDRTQGLGPLSDGTLRIRQSLVRRVLTLAWQAWRLIDTDLGGMIALAPPARPRIARLTPEQVTALCIALPPHLDDAALGAAWIGWRRANLIGDSDTRKGRTVPGLTWDRVQWPLYQDGRLIQPGLIWYAGDDSKNGAAHCQPMSARVEQLLRTRWTLRSGPLVFHDGTGRAWGDFRKTWASACAAAGLPAGTRWHDLRHTWASDLVLAGVSDRHVQELGGWKDGAMVRRYSHLRPEDLLDAVNRPGAL